MRYTKPNVLDGFGDQTRTLDDGRLLHCGSFSWFSCMYVLVVIPGWSASHFLMCNSHREITIWQLSSLNKSRLKNLNSFVNLLLTNPVLVSLLAFLFMTENVPSENTNPNIGEVDIHQHDRLPFEDMDCLMPYKLSAQRRSRELKADQLNLCGKLAQSYHHHLLYDVQRSNSSLPVPTPVQILLDRKAAQHSLLTPPPRQIRKGIPRVNTLSESLLSLAEPPSPPACLCTASRESQCVCVCVCSLH